MSKKPLPNNADVPWSKPSDAEPPCVKWPSNSASHWPRCNAGLNVPRGNASIVSIGPTTRAACPFRSIAPSASGRMSC